MLSLTTMSRNCRSSGNTPPLLKTSSNRPLVLGEQSGCRTLLTSVIGRTGLGAVSPT